MNGPLHFEVRGVPAPQGSRRAFRNPHNGSIQMVESSKAVKPWREAVKAAAVEAMGEHTHPYGDEPVRVSIVFRLPRPKSHYGTGRNCRVLKPLAPRHPAGKPDVDKLLRSCLDALTEAGVVRDDAQVVWLLGRKVYIEASTQTPGALFQVGLE